MLLGLFVLVDFDCLDCFGWVVGLVLRLCCFILVGLFADCWWSLRLFLMIAF